MQVLLEAEKALESGQMQWALELASHVLHVHPDDSPALNIRTAAILGTVNVGWHFLTIVIYSHQTIIPLFLLLYKMSVHCSQNISSAPIAIYMIYGFNASFI